MRELVIHIVHPDVERISDRSARQVLKALSISVRQAQSEDLRRFIFSLDLPYDRQHALADLLDAPIQMTPAYDLEELRKGSLVLGAVVSVAIIGEFVRVALRRLDDDEERLTVFLALKQHLRTGWPHSVLNGVVDHLKDGGLGARMIVDKCAVREEGEQLVADITAKTETDEDHKSIPRRKVETGDQVEALLDQVIEEARRP